MKKGGCQILKLSLIGLINACSFAESSIGKVADIGLEKKAFTKTHPIEGDITVMFSDGGEKYLPNGYFDMGDSIKIQTKEKECYYVNGWGFIDLTYNNKTFVFGKYDQNAPELSVCYELVDNLASLL